MKSSILHGASGTLFEGAWLW